MIKVLILGQNGMLGNAAYKFFGSQKDYKVLTTSERWPSESFKDAIRQTEAEVIINCIGAIPQKKPDITTYKSLNIDMPIFLESIGKKIIHPSTDCEFSGNVPKTYKYTKKDIRDAEDDYGKSKAEISALIENSFKNTKIIRTSIIGHEINTHLSLLDWFLTSENQVNGYTNHYWNGITTFQWAKLAKDIIENWNNYPTLNQYGTKDIMSKYEILNIVKDIYKKNITINPFEPPKGVNKCLESDIGMPSLKIQLQELKKFYNK